MIGTTPNIQVVNNSVPAKNLTEFIAYLKANPGRANYGKWARAIKAAGIQPE